MDRVKELLDRMDAEILEKTNAIVMQRDAEIKAKAQEAYDAKVEEEISRIKNDVEAQYATAKAYLTELLPVEENKEEEKAEDIVPENENNDVETTGTVEAGAVDPQVI